MSYIFLIDASIFNTYILTFELHNYFMSCIFSRISLNNKSNEHFNFCWCLRFQATCSLFLGPKYDSAQPSYPGFERDVFKTVSDYFYSLLAPVLTYELYELFINVLGRYRGLISGGLSLIMEEQLE